MNSRVTSSEAETEELAAEMAAALRRPYILTLSGDLGAGKTVFSRGFARALGVKGPVSSPTFSIVNEYDLPEGSFYHMDLYRISSDEEACALGIEDYLQDKTAISLIEWPERLSWLLPSDVVRVQIKHVSEYEREILWSDL